MAGQALKTEIQPPSVEPGDECMFCCNPVADLSRKAGILPCHHVCCEECYTAKYPPPIDSNTITCEICKKEHQWVEFDTLPLAVVKQESVSAGEEDEDEKIPDCDRCEKSPKPPAAVYCSDCAQKICITHKKFHDGYFGEVHKKIGIAEYQNKPHTYLQATHCDKHPEEVVKLICRICYIFSCAECISPGGQSGSNTSGHTHDFRILHDVDKELRDHYESKLRPLDSRIEALAKREKEIDREFDEITANCKDMLSEVNKRKNEQIALIEKQAENLRHRINKYENESARCFISRRENYMNEREKLQVMTNSTRIEIGEAHLKMLISLKQERTAQLEASCLLPVSNSTLKKINLRKGRKRKMEVDLTDNESDVGSTQYYTKISTYSNAFSYNRKGSTLYSYYEHHKDFFNTDGEAWD